MTSLIRYLLLSDYLSFLTLRPLGPVFATRLPGFYGNAWIGMFSDFVVSITITGNPEGRFCEY
jgi:hypothetical protein